MALADFRPATLEIVLRHRRVVLGVWGAVLVGAAISAAGLNARIAPGGEVPSDSQSAHVSRLITAGNLVAVVSGDGRTAARVRRFAAQLATIPPVIRTSPLATAPRMTLIGVEVAGGVDGANRQAPRVDAAVARVAGRLGLHARLTGYAAYSHALMTTAQTELERSERIGLIAVALILLLMFGSLAAAAVTVAIGASAVVIALGVVALFARAFAVSDFVSNATVMIGLALGVDYSMFLIKRQRELRAQGLGVEEAVRTTMATTGRAVLFSGLVVMAAVATLFTVDVRAVRSMELGVLFASAAALGAAMFVAPALMCVLGPRLDLPSRPMARVQRLGARPFAALRRVGPAIMARPVIALVVCAAVLLALAVPALRLARHVGVPSVDILPRSVEARASYDAAARTFGAGTLSPIYVVDGGARLRARLAHDPRVARVSAMRAGGSVAALRAPASTGASAAPAARAAPSILVVVPRADPYSRAAERLVSDIRAHAPPGALVGGATAQTLDSRDAMYSALPRVLLLVGLLMLGIMGVAFRSVVLPLKAVVLLALVLAATFGAMVALSGAIAISPIIPLLLIAVAVALSADYELLLILRIRELHLAGHGNRDSVLGGLNATASVITSAAVVMIAVFLSFGAVGVATVRQLALGLAAAIALDATIVRLVMVPATMRLLGRWNWWLPGVPPVRIRADDRLT